MINTLMTYGKNGYKVMIKPLPEVCRRAIIAYWGTQIGTWLVNMAIREIKKELMKHPN